MTPAAAFPYVENAPPRAVNVAPRAPKARVETQVAALPAYAKPLGAKPAGAKAAAAKPEPPKPPAGPLILSVSIGSQRVTVYDNGAPIASAPVSTGMPGHPTPMGIFSVIQKDRLHHSNLYSNAPMPFMQRITWSGVALHAGVLPGYPASHGCIRLPESFAVRLWGMTKMGARVIVSRNDTVPYDITHPRLADLAKKPDPAPPPAPEVRAPDAQPKAEAETIVVSAKPEIAAGAVVVASNTATAVKTDSAPDSLHDGAEHGIGFVSAPVPARPPVQPVAAVEKPADLRPALDAMVPIPPVKPAEPSLRSGPLALFVSRKEGKLFVRKGFEPLFDTPITIQHRELPLGTHVFTAGRPADGSAGLRWIAMSINDRAAVAPAPAPAQGKARVQREERPAPLSSDALRKGAAEALDRIELPPEVLDRISPLLAPGASLLISDQGLGDETGKDTDFIVVTK
jgi:lipoprotein-anchoring transpeptidase ErfK/SrfK